LNLGDVAVGLEYTLESYAGFRIALGVARSVDRDPRWADSVDPLARRIAARSPGAAALVRDNVLEESNMAWVLDRAVGTFVYGRAGTIWRPAALIQRCRPLHGVL